MKTITNSFAKLALLFAVLAMVLTVNYIQAAWTGPTAAPTGGNVPAPVNIGSTGQVKNGVLGLDGLSVTGDLIVTGSTTVGGSVLPSGGLTLEVDGKIGATEYCDSSGNNCVLAANLASGGSSNLIDTYAAYYGGLDTITVNGGLAKWPKAILCENTSAEVIVLNLHRYAKAGSGDIAQYRSAIDTVDYSFWADGFYKSRNNLNANCGAPGNDIVSICNNGQCVF